MFGLLFFLDCILTSHGDRGELYPTYCKSYVFTLRSAVFPNCDVFFRWLSEGTKYNQDSGL